MNKYNYLKELFPDELPYPYSERNYKNKLDPRETFNFDYMMIYWLYERFRYFQDEVSQHVNLNYHKFNIDGKELTYLECINRMVDDCKEIISNKDIPIGSEYFKFIQEKIEDLFKVLSKCFWSMWW